MKSALVLILAWSCIRHVVVAADDDEEVHDDAVRCVPGAQPTGDWPAETKDESMAAWPYKEQPKRLSCWPKTYNGIPVESCSGDTPLGAVHVLKDTSDILIWKLPRASWDLDTDRNSKSAEACKQACYQDKWCTHWQHRTDGCFREDYDNQLPYPLTTEYTAHNDDSTQTGEYIQHYCPTKFPVVPAYLIPPECDDCEGEDDASKYFNELLSWDVRVGDEVTRGDDLGTALNYATGKQVKIKAPCGGEIYSIGVMQHDRFKADDVPVYISPHREHSEEEIAGWRNGILVTTTTTEATTKTAGTTTMQSVQSTSTTAGFLSTTETTSKPTTTTTTTEKAGPSAADVLNSDACSGGCVVVNLTKDDLPEGETNSSGNVQFVFDDMLNSEGEETKSGDKVEDGATLGHFHIETGRRLRSSAMDLKETSSTVRRLADELGIKSKSAGEIVWLWAGKKGDIIPPGMSLFIIKPSAPALPLGPSPDDIMGSDVCSGPGCSVVKLTPDNLPAGEKNTSGDAAFFVDDMLNSKGEETKKGDEVEEGDTVGHFITSKGNKGEIKANASGKIAWVWSGKKGDKIEPGKPIAIVKQRPSSDYVLNSEECKSTRWGCVVINLTKDDLPEGEDNSSGAVQFYFSDMLDSDGEETKEGDEVEEGETVGHFNVQNNEKEIKSNSSGKVLWVYRGKKGDRIPPGKALAVVKKKPNADDVLNSDECSGGCIVVNLSKVDLPKGVSNASGGVQFVFDDMNGTDGTVTEKGDSVDKNDTMGHFHIEMGRRLHSTMIELDEATSATVRRLAADELAIQSPSTGEILWIYGGKPGDLIPPGLTLAIIRRKQETPIWVWLLLLLLLLLLCLLCCFFCLKEDEDKQEKASEDEKKPLTSSTDPTNTAPRPPPAAAAPAAAAAAASSNAAAPPPPPPPPPPPARSSSQPPSNAPAPVDKKEIRIDFEDATKKIHTFKFEYHPIGIVFTRRAPIKVDDFFKCNSLGKKMGVQKGWSIVRIQNHNVLKDHDFTHVDSLLMANLKTLPTHPLEIEMLTPAQEQRTILLKKHPLSFEYSKHAPFKVSKIIGDGGEAAAQGVQVGWQIKRVAEHEVTTNTGHKELNEWLMEALKHLPHG
mmetsp:Transcript_2471/g.5359  ORF Transcript_2471/g.5359 Transcript_2471/m.5359 type:complete len:1110 (-) Transcript_2471:116-3445(-)